MSDTFFEKENKAQGDFQDRVFAVIEHFHGEGLLTYEAIIGTMERIKHWALQQILEHDEKGQDDANH